MKTKKAKSQSTTATQPSKVETELPDVQSISDSLIKLVQDFGFRQIIPPPFQHKRVFVENREVFDRFGSILHEVDSRLGEDHVLAPTQVYNAYKGYLEHVEQFGPRVRKWFYLSPVPREVSGEPAIKHELGVFVFGENSPLAMAQLINASGQLLEKLGIEEAVTEINSVGCESCQKEFQEILESHFTSSSPGFCETCSDNLAVDPIKMLSCQEPGCQEVLAQGPQIVDFLDEQCRLNLIGTLEVMDELEIPYVLNPYLAATPFNKQVLFRTGVSSENGFQVMCQGGDYSICAEHLQLDAVPTLGITTSVERLSEHIVPENISRVDRVDVFVISLGDLASRRAMRLYQDLRRSGIVTAEAMIGNSGIKRQLREAQARKPGVALIVGHKEALDDTVILRDMQSGMQEVFTSERILDEVKKRLDS